MESKRQLQTGELIKRNFSSVLQSIGRNIYGDILVSVTQAMVSPDLSQVKIYVSAYGTDNKEAVISLLEQNAHMLKQELAHRIRKHIRRIPDVYYYLDDTLDEMYRIDVMFKKLSDD